MPIKPVQDKSTPAKKTTKSFGNSKLETIGGLADTMYALREDKRALEDQVKVIEDKYAIAEQALMDLMVAQKTEKGSGSKASVSITKTTVATVEDWDAFHAYIYKNKLGHLLQRRVADPAYRELLELGKKVPGVTPFVKARLNVRVLP